jgi:predicted Zn finger-like uncharacterized protein
LLTQCPQCETTFRVTADILRVADGQVRCGRCQTQFDALERLLEEGDPSAAESGRFLQTPSVEEDETIEVDEPESMEEITLEGKHIEISGTYRTLDDGTGEPRTRHEVVEEWVEIEDEPLATDAIGTSRGDADEYVPATHDADAEAEQPILARRERSRFDRDDAESSAAADDLSLFATPRKKSTALAWKLLVLPLALLLLFQVIHHHRAELARHPTLGGSLMSMYRGLGLRLTPDWNLHAYGVKQWGVVLDAATPGTLKVRASITNNAAFAQPYPLLKLVLEDRWGDQVRAREFEPAEYLDPGIAPDRLLGPAQQANATISIVDPGPDAEGFRFDVCLHGTAGTVCAAEVPQ